MVMTRTEAALFSDIGPRGKRRILIGTLVSLIALLALCAAVIAVLAHNGQFAYVNWWFFLNSRFWLFFAQGLWGTVAAAVGSGLIAVPFGLILMLGRMSAHAPLRWISTVFIEFMRGTPTLLFIYFMFLVPGQFGLKVGAYWMVVVPTSFYAAAVLAEVYRSGVQAVPQGQKDAVKALGLSHWQGMTSVILPQMLRIVAPTMVSQLVVVVKSTTFGYVVTYPELMQNAKVAIANYNSLLPIYLAVAMIYVLLNLSISRLALWLSRRTGEQIIPATAHSETSR